MKPFPSKGGLWSVVTGVTLAASVVYLGWIVSSAMGAPELPWDDNFITYAYSRNLAAGHGLRFNAVDDTPTEGFSGLSHVLLVALGYMFQFDPLATTRGLSLFFFMLAPLVVGVPLGRLLRVPVPTALTVSSAGQIMYLLSDATFFNLKLGMETIIFMGSLACLAGWSLAELDPGSATRTSVRHVAFGCLATTLVTLGRPEGPLLVILTLGTVTGTSRFLPSGQRSLRNRSSLLVALFSMIMIAGYFTWRKLYFGFLLPNPYYVKSHNTIMGMKLLGFPGWEDTQAFLALLLPWLAAAIPLFFLAPRRERRILLLSVLPGVLAVLSYARVVHEAAIAYRYEFPFLIYLHLLLAGLLCLAGRRLRTLPLVLVPFAVAWVTFVAIGISALRNKPGTFAWLDVRISKGTSIYAEIGSDLARTGLGQRATIALGAAGAIPYYSGYQAIDLVGLNDNFLSGRVPHTGAAVWNYIESRKPDVFQSGLPPASPATGLDQVDPAMEARVVKMTLQPDSGLPRFWDQEKLLEMVRREMIYLREHYVFGAAYSHGDGWMILYLRKDSPFREQIRKAIETSSARADFETNWPPSFFPGD